MFISLYTTRLVLNSLGASDFGIFNIVGGAIAMLGFLNGAMASATQRFMSFAEGAGEKNNEKIIFNVSVVLHVILAIIVGLALIIAGVIFFNGILNIPKDRLLAAEVVYGSLIISTMFTVITVPYDAAMNAHENMKYYAIIGIFESILKLLVAFITVYTLQDKLIVYGVLMAAIPFVTLTIMRVYCHRKYEECVISPKKYWDNQMIRRMTSFAGWNFTSSASSLVTQYGLGIMLNSFFGTILNAAMGVANQLSGMLMTFSNSMTKALSPVIVKSAGSGDKDTMIKSSLIGSKYSYFLLAIFAIPFIFEMPMILKLWLKNIPDWAILFCQLQLIRSLLEGTTGYISTMVNATGKIKGISISKSILSIMPLFLSFLSFYLKGSPYWLYIWWIVCWGILNNIASLYYANKICGLRYNDYIKYTFYPIFVVSLISTITCLVIRFVFIASYTRLFAIFFISMTIFIFIAYVTMSSSEKKATNSIIYNNILRRRHE